MTVLTLAAVLCIAFYLAWRFEDTLLGVLPTVVCAVGLALYGLAFFRRMSLIDVLLLAAGALAVWAMVRKTKREGRQALAGAARRLLADPYFWAGVAAIAVMCVLLRGEQILEWDGYNFWGPDTRSLYFRDGFAPKYANTAPEFGDYPPFSQLIWWWGLHLAGEYREEYIFFAYYAFGALLLLSVADRFRRGEGKSPWIAVPACAAAILLPGAACTAWLRALCVDPLMSMLFGCAVSLVVCRDERHTGFWRGKLAVCLLSLSLVKSIGLMWSALALIFYCLWWRERREWPFALAGLAGCGACFGSWKLFCTVTERSTALVTSFSALAAERLGELARGEFLTAGNNWGYIKSYAKAFLFTPIHREYTGALDLSPAALILLMFAGAAALWKFGFVPRKKLGRLLGFMVLSLGLIYGIMMVGQMTMFYPETQYLEPLRAATLMTRYCAPANMGLLILLVTFASGRAAGSEAPPVPEGRRLAAFGICAAVLFSCGAYDEMYRRFIYDPLDEQRIELRDQYRAACAGFVEAAEAIPLDEEGGRAVLGIYGMWHNPIMANETAPVSIMPVVLSEDPEADLAAVRDAVDRGHGKYLYFIGCSEALARELSACTTDGAPFQSGVLYTVGGGEDLELTAVQGK